jgi:hypothetical protein
MVRTAMTQEEEKMDSERQDPADRADPADVSDPDDGPEESDTEGHSLLQAELHRTIAASRAKEVADWGRSEQARRLTQEAKKRRSR